MTRARALRLGSCWGLLLLLGACGGEDVGGPGGPEDAATRDADRADAARDAALRDAGGSPEDAGPLDDAGADPDAASPDAAAMDASPGDDGGGEVDSGGALDASPADVGTADTGTPGRDAGGGGDSGPPALTCSSCHGDDTSPAPPHPIAGTDATTERGVGAHRSHLRASSWHREVVCSDCHRVPTDVLDPGHLDTPLPAELTWGDVAVAGSASPGFDGTTCSGVYCHGATLLPGGSNTTPTWTRVDGTEAVCGSCHGLPPGGTHPVVAAGSCSACHPTIDATMTFIAPERHIDGHVDLLGGCTLCHGSDGNPAPPSDTTGGTALTLRGVGAHRSHLGPSTWHAEVTCAQCHRVPASVGDPGHNDTALPAELTWGDRAVADSASPGFDGTTCSGVYCHGATLLPGGSNTTPTWARVDGTQAACGTCHGLPPGGTHPAGVTDCSSCHGEVVDAARNIIAPARHIDGIVDVSRYHPPGWAAPTEHGRTFNAAGPAECQRCHGAALTGGVGVSCESCHPGWQTSCTFCHGDRPSGDPAPPEGVDGELARTVLEVGAHQEHVSDTPIHLAWDCDLCHGARPTSALSPGHIDGDGRAEVVFGPVRGAGTTYDGATGTCGNTYCHGNGLLRASAPLWPTDPTLDCGSCHAPFSGATAAQLTAMSGEHDRHVRSRRRPCSACHGDVVSSTGALLRVDLHVDGVVQLNVAGYLAADPMCGGNAGCNPMCHGHECW